MTDSYRHPIYSWSAHTHDELAAQFSLAHRIEEGKKPERSLHNGGTEAY